MGELVLASKETITAIHVMLGSVFVYLVVGGSVHAGQGLLEPPTILQPMYERAVGWVGEDGGLGLASRWGPGCGKPDISYPSKSVGEFPVNSHTSPCLLGNRVSGVGMVSPQQGCPVSATGAEAQNVWANQLIRLTVNWIT